MNLGMIGAIGGIGGGLAKEADRMYEQEKEDRADVRQRSFQDWLMKKKQEYQIEDEGRAEARDVRKEERTDRRGEESKDRDFERTQREAPARRDIKAEDEKASARAKSEAAAENVDRDAGVKKKLTEAGVDDATRNQRNATAEYYRERPTAATSGSKLSGADSEEAKTLRQSIEDTRKKIRDARLDGSWSDDALTPGQKKVQAELIATEKRYQSLLQGARESAPGKAPARSTPDPLNLRKPAGGAGGSMIGPKDTGNDDSPAGIINNEYRKAKTRLATETNPEVRARLQGDIEALKDEAKRGGFALNDVAPGAAATPVSAKPAAPLATAKMPAPAAAPKPAAVATPAAPAPAGSPKAALDNLLGGSDPMGGSTGQPAASPDVRSKVDTLKAKVRGAAPAAAPAVDPVMDALGAAGSSSIDRIVGQQAPALKQAADQIRAAQQQVVQAANSQNPQAVQQATAAVSAAAQRLDALLKDMNPAQAQQVKKALGLT